MLEGLTFKLLQNCVQYMNGFTEPLFLKTRCQKITTGIPPKKVECFTVGIFTVRSKSKYHHGGIFSKSQLYIFNKAVSSCRKKVNLIWKLPALANCILKTNIGITSLLISKFLSF